MKYTKAVLLLLSVMMITLLVEAGASVAGQKEQMSRRMAQVLAERALGETIYGLKVRSTEEVKDMVSALFVGISESKTNFTLSGVNFDEVVYDPKRDIAKATASVQIDQIENINGQVISLNNKVFRRVAYGTSTPANAGPIKALRAAEIDGYTQLAKRVVGFQLESQTTVENFILKSDLVKTKLMAALCMAEVKEYGWDDSGNAFVKMMLSTGDLSEMLGQQVVGAGDVIEVEGFGAQVNDLKK